MDTTALVATVKRELDKQNMTYKELSALSGVPLDTLNNFFRGKTKNPRIDTLQAIEAALGLSKPFEWTAEDKASGIGNHPTNLSDKEWEWLELRAQVIGKYGEAYLDTVEKMLQVLIEKDKQ